MLPVVEDLGEQKILFIIPADLATKLEERPGLYLDLHESWEESSLTSHSCGHLVGYPVLSLPLDDISDDVRPTLCGVLHHPLLQGKVPDVELRDLPTPGLARMKAAALVVLILSKVDQPPRPHHGHGLVPGEGSTLHLDAVNVELVQVLVAVVGDAGRPPDVKVWHLVVPGAVASVPLADSEGLSSQVILWNYCLTKQNTKCPKT